MSTTTKYPKYDKDTVKSAARGQWINILVDVAGIPRDRLDGKHHACPLCNQGVDCFRLVDEDAGAVFCNKCFSSRNGDGIAAVMKATNTEFPAALALIANRLHVAPINGESNSNGQHSDPLKTICRDKGMPEASALAYGAVADKATVSFPSWNEAGEALSSFTIWATDPDPTKRKGKWPKGGKAGMFLEVVDGAAKLPQPGETRAVVEGVKDAAALHGLGVPAVGLNTCKLAQRFVPLLRGVHVLLIPDRDTAGVEGATQAAARLYGVAASVKIVALPAEVKPKDGADVRDILRQENGEQLVRQAIEQAQPWEPIKANEQPSDSIAHEWQRTEAANARRLVRLHGRDMRYIAAWVSWLVWDGARWQDDATCLIDAKAKEVAHGLWDEANAIANSTVDADLAKAVKGFARSSNYASGISHMIDLARSEPGIAITHRSLDNADWLLNVCNGTIDLRTGKMRHHDRDDLISKQCAVVFDLDADCPLWLRFLNDITFGDQELITFLRRLVGYCLTGSVRDHVLPFLYGAGANGKSVFTTIVMALLGGDYAMRAAPELLMAKGNDTHPTERADLFGKRLVISNEIEAGKRLNESLVKDLTGGDNIRARRMREDFWEFRPTHKVWIVGNHKPVIRGTDNGIWRRVKLIPFARIFKPEEQDKELPAKLLRELSGILNWALSGCIEWQAEGLIDPPAVARATAEYREEQDIVAAFIEDKCVVLETAKVRAGQLYDAFRDWSEASGERAIGKNTFGEEIAKRFERRASNGKWYLGLGLAGDTLQ